MFNKYQPSYAFLRIPVFPCGGPDGKRPLIGNYARIGLSASARLRQPRFEGANVGLMCGKRSGLTILDIDDTSEELLADCLSRHGESEIVTRTGSGKFQVWYKHNGEGRSIRPDPSRPVDLLGGGMAIVPPSKRPEMGFYEFLKGDLEDVDDLKPMKALPSKIIREGSRTKELFKAMREQAAKSPAIGLDELIAFGEVWSMGFCEKPLEQSEIVRQAGGVLKLIEQGRCWTSGTYFAGVKEELFHSLTGDALKLYLWLRGKNHDRQEFAFGVEGVAFAMSWPIKKTRLIRDELDQKGLIVRTHKGGARKGDTSQFRFS